MRKVSKKYHYDRAELNNVYSFFGTTSIYTFTKTTNMSLEIASLRLHWNYFLALESDLGVASRYVEFNIQNCEVYSIEFAHLLFAAASEIDVVAKLLCENLMPRAQRKNINDYKKILLSSIPELPKTRINLITCGLEIYPWRDWNDDESSVSPIWWKSYNNIKHERHLFFHEATLKNALLALGALLILIFHLYSRSHPTSTKILSLQETTRLMQPTTSLLRFDPNYYFQIIIG